MDFDKGGLNSSEQQRRTAAEIARSKVLAAYSSTAQSLKNLPPSAKNTIINNHHITPRRSDNVTMAFPDPRQQIQPDWIHQANQDSYQHAPIYSNSTAHSTANTQNLPSQPSPKWSQNSQSTPRPHEFSPSYNPAPAEPAAPAPNYNTSAGSNLPQVQSPSALKDLPVDQSAINAEWKKYHSAWQDYYKNYYSEYYSKAAQNYLATEKMKTERIATGQVERKRRSKRFIPLFIILAIFLVGLFLQYNRLIFTPIMAYISPDSGNVTTGLEAVDPTVTGEISPDPRLIIPKLNVDTPVIFGITTDQVDAAMNEGVAQFAIPGANALPGQIGNLAISGHSSGDIYSGNQYKFIFSGLERLEPGDLIYINYNSVRYTYQMTRSEVVEPTDVEALIYPTEKPMLTLITCTPLGTSRYRLLITAEQISPNYGSTPENPDTPSENPENPENPTPETPSDNDSNSSNTMPSNEPGFFESIWKWLTGQ